MSAHDHTTFTDIPGFPGYKIGPGWSVWTFLEWTGIGQPYSIGTVGRKLSCHRNKQGYLRVTIYVDKKQRCVFVHRLILSAFKGPRPDGCECRHLDGNPANNDPSNLEWGTSKDNHRDRIRHGRTSPGSRNGQRKLHEADIPMIRAWVAAGVTRRDAARQVGVSNVVVGLIVSGKSWGHVP